MKKKFLVCIAVMIAAAAINVNAQEESNSKGFIGINGGYTLPFGNFAKSDYLDLSAGFAKGGPVFSLDGAYFFNKHIGVGGLVSLAYYKVKDQDVLSAGYVEAFAVDEVTMTVNSYTSVNVLPAFYFTIPANKLNVDFRVMLGYSFLKTPEIKVQLEDNVDNPLIQNASSGSGIGFGVGAGLRYAFTPHFGAALRVDYLGSKPNVDITYTNLNNPTDEFRMLTNYNELISSLNTSLGLFYKF